MKEHVIDLRQELADKVNSRNSDILREATEPIPFLKVPPNKPPQDTDEFYDKETFF